MLWADGVLCSVCTLFPATGEEERGLFGLGLCGNIFTLGALEDRNLTV